VVAGQDPKTGTVNAESGLVFTVKIESSASLAPGNATVSADLHFDADKNVAKGTTVLLGAGGDSSQSTVGGHTYPQTANTLQVDVRPYNASGGFGGKNNEMGYIRFSVTDSQSHSQTGTLDVNVVSRSDPGALRGPPPADFKQRLIVPVPDH